MKAISQHVHGAILVEDERVALLLRDSQPAAKAPDSVYLRYAFVPQGIENSIFPAFVLDDWGSEIRGLELYEWVRDFGHQFPRAELFGYDLDGREVQYFLRELELHTRLSCYAWEEERASLEEALLVDALALPDQSVSTAVRIQPPKELSIPLTIAKVSWWRVNPKTFPLGTLFD